MSDWLDKNMNTIILGDSYEIIKNIPDNSIDLVIIDPPYKLNNKGGGLYSLKRDNLNYQNFYDSHEILYSEEIKDIKDGFNKIILDELVRVMKKINIYIWCSQKQIIDLLDYFVIKKKCNFNIMTWHKSNPVPSCGNKYLSDTEYLLFFREKGVKVFGEYKSKSTYYVTQTNKADKDKYKHPTIKPLFIIENLIVNSSEAGGVVLDCFAGTGTTLVASKKHGRNFIGIEINEDYYKTSIQRLDEEERQLALF